MPPFHSINPTTGLEIAQFEEDTPEQVEAKLEAAHRSQRALAAASWTDRASWMSAAAALIESETDLVARAITEEMGKPIAQSRAEVAKSAYAMRYYAEHAERFLTGRTIE